MFKKDLYIRLFLIFLISTSVRADVPDIETYKELSQNDGPLNLNAKILAGTSYTDPYIGYGGYGGYSGYSKYSQFYAGGIYGGPDSNSGYGGDQNSETTFGVYNPNTKLSFDIRYSSSFCPSKPIQIDTNKYKLCCFRQLKIVAYANALCCGDVPYDPLSQICCSGKLYTVNAADLKFFGCCKDNLYDQRVKVCCNNNMYEIDTKLLVAGTV